MARPTETITPMSCPVCTTCIRDTRFQNRCMLGGPYIGYSREDGTVEDREGKVLGTLTRQPRIWFEGEQG